MCIDIKASSTALLYTYYLMQTQHYALYHLDVNILYANTKIKLKLKHHITSNNIHHYMQSLLARANSVVYKPWDIIKIIIMPCMLY